jgi:hypothetical protein
MKFLKKLFKIGLVLGLLLLVVLVGAFFYVNSGSFIQKHVLPAASDALQQDVTAAQVKFSIFKTVEFSDLRVGANDGPLFTAKVLRVRYDALAALSGKIHVQEITVESAVANLSDEKLKELQGEKTDSPAPSPDSGSGSGDELDLDILIENITISDVTLNYSQAGEAPMQASVSNLSVTLPSLRNNGEEFALTIGADAAYSQPEAVDVTAKLALAITGKLTGLKPGGLNLKASVTELAGTANGAKLPSPIFSLEIDAQPSGDAFAVVKTLNVRDGESILAHSRAEGNISMAGAGAFDIEAQVPDARLLNLLATFAGDYDFGDTNLGYKGKLTLTDDGGAVSTGKLLVHALSVASEKAEIPRLDPLGIALNHEVGYNCESNILALTAFDCRVNSKARDIVTATLSDAIELKLDDPEAAAGEASASFPLVIDGLDLNLFSPFIPASEAFTLKGGQVNAKIDIAIEKGGKDISATGFSELAALEFMASGKDFKDYGIRKEFTAKLKDMQSLTGSNNVAFTRRGSETFFTAATSSAIGLKPLTADIKTTLKSEGKGLWETIAAFVGDYDFGDTQLAGDVTVNLADNKAKVGAAIQIDQLTVAAEGIPALRPLAIGLALAALQDLKASTTQVASFKVTGMDGEKPFLDLTLDNPISIDASGKEPKANDFAISATLHPLALDFIAPFTKDAGVSGLGGSVASNLKIGVGGLGKSLTVAGDAKLAKVTAKVDGSGELTKPITAVTTLDIAFADFKTLTVNTLIATVSDGSADLAKVELGGKMQVPLGPELTDLTVTVPDPIDADALLALWKAEESAKSAEETPAPETGEKPAEFPDMWVEAHVSVNEVHYREIVAKDITTHVVIKERKATVNDTRLKLNDGSITIKGAADLADLKALAFKGDAQVENIQFSPIIKSFAPDLPVTIGGGLKSFSADFSGTGTAWEQLSKSLLADAEFALDALTLKQATDGKLTQALALLLTTVGLNWEDMTFADGHGAFNAKEGTLNIAPLQVTAHELRLNSTGSLSMETWEPDLKFGIAVADGLSRRLERKRIPLRPIPGDARFKSAPDFKVYGPMDTKELTKTVVWEYTKSFAQNALINEISERSPEAAAIFGALTGGNKTTTKEGDGEKPESGGGALGNLIGVGLNALGGQKQAEKQSDPPAQQPEKQQPAEAEKEAPPPANEATNLINTGLRIFGAVQEQREREKREEEVEEKPAENAPEEKPAPPPPAKDAVNDAVNGVLNNLFK